MEFETPQNAHKAGIDKVILNADKTVFLAVKNGTKANQTASDFLRGMGIS